MSTALATLTNKLAQTLGMGGDGRELIETLKATAFKGQVTDAQMTALMIVANQYGLNPWTKEVYAFPDKQNGIVPVVGVDGWSRIVNSHPQLDGIQFEQDAESCTCKIYRKDRAHPTVVTEFMDECKRNTGPWGSHPKRMLRHKALIQCARLAFGYSGIYDQDEAERIQEAQAPQRPVVVEVIPTEDATALDEIVQAMRNAPDEDALSDIASSPAMDDLTGKQKDLARDAYRARRQELKEAA